MTSEIFTFKQIDKDPYLSSHTGIYQISNISGKYIGSTGRSFKRRLQDHIEHLRNNKHHSRYLQHSFNKYGEKSLSISILEEMSDTEKLLEREQHWMDLLQPEFNCCPVAGSNLGYFNTFEEAVEARRKAEECFWSDKFESKSKEDQLKALQLYKEERYLLRDKVSWKNKLGQHHISTVDKKYVCYIRGKQIGNRCKTIEEAVLIRDNHIQKLLTEIREDSNYVKCKTSRKEAISS